jgi:uncharacterized protein (TIGR02147 family)
MPTPWRPNIFDYLDYRKYLEDFYSAGKENVDAFSHRYFARRAGFSSSNYIQLVWKGKRNLTPDSTRSLCRAMELPAEEAAFFTALVQFDQSEDPEEKNRAFEEVAASRAFRQARQIDHSMWEYLSHWYYPAIREMAGRPDFRADAKWISGQLYPKVPEKKVGRALELLFELGLLIEDDDGAVTRGEPTLTTGHVVRKLAASNYHREMIARGAEAIELHSAKSREIAGTTVCISAATVPELKQRIRTFRETIVQRCDSDEEPDVVYQFNIQLFPLSSARGETS